MGVNADFVDFRGRFEQDEQGVKLIERGFRVTGLAGTLEQQQTMALASFGVPQLGERHPEHPKLYVTTRSPEANSPGVVDVTVTYERKEDADSPLEGKITWETGTSQTETIYDIDGEYIFVDNFAAPLGTQRQYGTMPIDIPTTVMTFTRTEKNPPDDKSELYVGKLNSGQWSIRGRMVRGSDQARTWKCTRIGGQPQDDGTYSVTYQWERNPKGWDGTIQWLDPETGRVPDIDALGLGEEEVLGVLIKTIKTQGEVDFGALGL